MKKESASMTDIINDLVKGAKENTFGRPVNIQMAGELPDWTPLDTAKCAGMLVALGEQGYSVKEAAEFLGLSEQTVQKVIQAVG